MAEPVRMWTRESLAEHLEVEVLPAAHRTGEPLPSERSLAESLSVSRTLVREALRGLEQRGLVAIVPGKGAFACEPSTGEAARSLRDAILAGAATRAQVAEARITLETRMAALAARRATASDLAAIRRALADVEQADSVVTRAIADIAFHSLVARASHNPVLSTMFASISTLVFEGMLRSRAGSGQGHRTAASHRSLMEALESGDAQAAGRAMAEHLGPAQGHAHDIGDEGDTGGDRSDRSDRDDGGLDRLDDGLDRLVGAVLHRAYGRPVPLEEIVSTTLQTYLNVGAARPPGPAGQAGPR